MHTLGNAQGVAQIVSMTSAGHSSMVQGDRGLATLSNARSAAFDTLLASLAILSQPTRIGLRRANDVAPHHCDHSIKAFPAWQSDFIPSIEISLLAVTTLSLPVRTLLISVSTLPIALRCSSFSLGHSAYALGLSPLPFGPSPFSVGQSSLPLGQSSSAFGL